MWSKRAGPLKKRAGPWPHIWVWGVALPRGPVLHLPSEGLRSRFSTNILRTQPSVLLAPGHTPIYSLKKQRNDPTRDPATSPLKVSCRSSFKRLRIFSANIGKNHTVFSHKMVSSWFKTPLLLLFSFYSCMFLPIWEGEGRERGTASIPKEYEVSFQATLSPSQVPATRVTARPSMRSS